MKRALFLSIICLTIIITVPAYAAFSDLEQKHSNYDAIQYVQIEGIVGGYPDGTYRPDQEINRAEFLKIILEAQATDYTGDGPPPAPSMDCFFHESKQTFEQRFGIFSDIDFKAWYAGYFCYGLRSGIVKGYSDRTFRPASSINFVEAAKIIIEADTYFDGNLSVNDGGNWYEGYVRALEERKAIPLSISSFDQKITRGEMAEIIYRLITENIKKPSLSYATLEGNGEEVNVNAQQGQDKDLPFLLSKLKDPNYTDTYGDGYTWYIAAEELGLIGKPAIPFLIEKLDTTDDFERTQTLYALLLAAQNENVRMFTSGEYVKGNGMAFPEPQNHPEIVNSWKEWFEKYKGNF